MPCLLAAMFDRDCTGTIDMQEFQALFNYITQWRAIFDQYDRDRSGAVDGSELNASKNQYSVDFLQFCLVDKILRINCSLVALQTREGREGSECERWSHLCGRRLPGLEEI